MVFLFCFHYQNVDSPYHVVFEENPQFKDATGSVRVDKMFQHLQSILGEVPPKFLLCILEKKNSDVYGNTKHLTFPESYSIHLFFFLIWKILSLRSLEKEKSCSMWNCECIVPPQNLNDQYLTNLLLKINAKVMISSWINLCSFWYNNLIVNLCHFCIAWWIEFSFGYGAVRNNASGNESSYHHYWNGCISWFSWTVWSYTIHCRGNIVFFFLFHFLVLYFYVSYWYLWNA